MTRIAIVADIHGNMPAFEAVLADLKDTTPDAVYVNGDIVNRGPQSEEALDTARRLGWPIVFGNHEEYMVKIRAGTIEPELRTEFWQPTRDVALTELSAEEVAYLDTLPRHLTVDVPGLPAIRLVHGSMRALNEGLGPWLNDSELQAATDGAPEPIIVGAHSHRPFNRRLPDRWVLNSGAVGMPYNGDPGAQYLVMTGENGQWQTLFRSIPYDRKAVYAAWEQHPRWHTHALHHVLRLELETATYHLGIYLRFCELRGLDTNALSSFDAYVDYARTAPPHTIMQPTGK